MDKKYKGKTLLIQSKDTYDLQNNKIQIKISKIFTMIKIAIQKSGRLNEESLGILKKCGISIDNGKDQLKAPARNFPMEVLYLRNGDIPQYLRDGVVDLAIIGENLIHEKGKDLTIIENLGFSKCRVSIAVPKEVDFNDLKDLNGKRIATSYPNTVNQFLAENAILADLHIINGSVEIAPNIGLADAICDIVSSGSTLLRIISRKLPKFLNLKRCWFNHQICLQKSLKLLRNYFFVWVR